MSYAKKMILKNAVSSYPGGRKKLTGRFSRFSNFADTAVFKGTVVLYNEDTCAAYFIKTLKKSGIVVAMLFSGYLTTHAQFSLLSN